MSTKTFIAISALSLLAAGSAFAVEATQDFPINPWNPKAFVQAERSVAQLPAVTNESAYTVLPMSSASRAQVVAETREAQRLGLIGGGESTPSATPAQLEQIRAAGLRALDVSTAAAR